MERKHTFNEVLFEEIGRAITRHRGTIIKPQAVALFLAGKKPGCP